MAVSDTLPKILRYPTRKIDTSDDYLSIQILKYIAPGFGGINGENLTVETSSGKYQNQQSLQTIFLPIPEGISDTSSVGWGDDSLNTAEALIANNLANVLQSKEFYNGIKNAVVDIGTGIQNATTNGAAQKAVISAVVSNLTNSLGGNTSPEGILTRATGQVLNPHMELLFKSVTLRSFSFGFIFAPRDANEALQVKQIIRSFKKYMSPKNAGVNNSTNAGPGGIFISSPNVFQLEYRTGNQKHPFLNSFKPMALTNMSVNYAASGPYSTYEDATPVHLSMTLQFQELNPVYFEDYDDSDIGVGY
jgi:hypothetical protein